jgi:adenine-specific DNA-methyltransferase
MITSVNQRTLPCRAPFLALKRPLPTGRSVRITNTLHPTSRDRIAAWFLDSDYDGRTFCICQAFFPDKTKWAKLAKALGQKGVIDESAFEALSGLRSLPFPKGKYGQVAVKVIDPRGNEGLRVMRLP